MSIRTERVARLLQREIAEILVMDYSEHLHGMVTVTGTRTTKDLGIVYVYVSIMGETDVQKEALFAHLNDLNVRIRTSLARRIRHQLKAVPEIRFFLDKTLERAQRIEDIFDKIRSEQDGRA